MALRIQLRRDTAANWTSENPTLAQGEYGYETDTKKHKVGDGSTAWASLAYASGLIASNNLSDVASASTARTNLGAVALINSATALVDGATIDLTAIKHTLSCSVGRTFTISYTGDDITLIITLAATSGTFTFPATTLCVADGTASGDNTMAFTGVVSGDKLVIAIKKVGSDYYAVGKNFGQ